MPLSNQLNHFLQSKLTSVLSEQVLIDNVSPVTGGSINQAYCLETNTGKYMMKLNSKSAYPNMFACEALGLQTIATTKAIAVPEVILQDDFEDESFLVLQWTESRKPTEKSSELLGQHLAEMHKNTTKQFGFEHDNYMGSLMQSNRKHNTWSSFYIEERLQPMVKIAVDKGLFDKTDVNGFERLYSELNNLFDEEQPSLIHGDLWSGNYLIGIDETPYLIDPAVSYGNREFDIAMTTLFGGFSNSFYSAYHQSSPLNNDWQDRVDLWNIYPLLLHLNLFGIRYLEQVRDGVKGYV